MEDQKVVQKSIDAANQYIKDKYPDSEVYERHIVANAFAHGYYMGFKRAEVSKVWDKERLSRESVDSTMFYMKNKFSQGGPSDHDKSLMFICMGRGFKAGVNQCLNL